MLPMIGNFYCHFPFLLCWCKPGPSLSYWTSLHLFEGWKGGDTYNAGGSMTFIPALLVTVDQCSTHGHAGAEPIWADEVGGPGL